LQQKAMKKVILFLLLTLLLVLALDAYTNTPNVRTATGAKPRRGIAEEVYLPIGGCKQYVLIRGVDTGANPVLLLLHGGPGASGTPLYRKHNGELEQHFTVVYWDQRGAGKSFHKKLDPNTFTVEQHIQDARDLINYLRQRFGKQKIFLAGHSWGSRLGMYLVQRYPEMLYAFAGIGQEVDSYEGERQSYEYTLQKAKEKNHKKALHDLMESGAPRPAHSGELYRNGWMGLVNQKKWLLKLGGERYGKTHYFDWIATMLTSPEYSLIDIIKWSKGSAFSASSTGRDPKFWNFHLREEMPKVEIPVFFISGKCDYNTPWPLVKEYYEKLEAPQKAFFLFERSGHSPIVEEPTRFNALIREKFLPLSAMTAKNSELVREGEPVSDRSGLMLQ
jgi:pimeloyl-ACP methyl ester carboxylesterase